MQLDPTILARSMLKRRQKSVVAAGITWLIQRPTAYDLLKLRESTTNQSEQGMEFILRNVVGWENVLERDILPGESDSTVDFNSTIARIYLEDHPDAWGTLNDAIWELVNAHGSKIEDVSKN